MSYFKIVMYLADIVGSVGMSKTEFGDIARITERIVSFCRLIMQNWATFARAYCLGKQRNSRIPKNHANLGRKNFIK